MNKFALAAILIAAPAGPAFAASGNASTTSGTANATIVNPIVLTHTAGTTLAFGKFTRGTGGTVVVTSAGVASVTGDVGLVPGSTSSADGFAVSGDASRSFSIATTGGNVTSGAATMAFTTAASAVTGTTSAAGAAAFTVGGTLTVSGSQVAGAYTGTYNATVNYN